VTKQETTVSSTDDVVITLSLTAVALVTCAAVWMFLIPSETPDFAAHIYWYLGRSSGLVAYWLLFGSVALGIAVSSRVFDGMLGRPWVFEVHKFLSIFVLLTMLFHVLILLPDPWAKFTIVEMFVPFKSHYRPTPVALGTLAFYGSLIVTASFYLKRFIGGQKGWRWLHYATFALFVMALLHGLLSGTDSERPTVQYSYLVSGVAVLFLVFFRMLATRAYGGKPRAEKPAVPRAAPVAAKPAPQPAASAPAPVAPQPVMAEAVAQPQAQPEAVSPPPPPQPVAPVSAPVAPQPVVAQAVGQPSVQPEAISPRPAPEPAAPAPAPVSPEPVVAQAVAQPTAQPEVVAAPASVPVSPPPVAAPPASARVEIPPSEPEAAAPTPVAQEEAAAEPAAPAKAPAPAPVPHATPPHAAPVEPREPVLGIHLN
jgi:cytochrome b561